MTDNPFYKYLLVSSSIILFISLLFSGLFVGSFEASMLGFGMLLLCLPALLISVILLIFKSTRLLGLAILASIGIMILSGCCVCSMGSGFNMH